MFIGEKPSLYFKKHPEKKSLGNYNTDTPADKFFREYIKKFFEVAYATDMVKQEGLPEANFKTEWYKEPLYKDVLSTEIKKLKPKAIGLMSKKVEELFNSEFPEYRKIATYISHPAYIVRYGKKSRWDQEFYDLKLLSNI